MVAHPFVPRELVGRQTELQQVSRILAADGDLLLAGVPGSGRQTLLRYAAQAVGARVVAIDCLRATDRDRFLQLLADAILTTFEAPSDRALIQTWSQNHSMPVLQLEGRSRLPGATRRESWPLFQRLLGLPQFLAEHLNCRVVMMFQNFPHIRSWDRSDQWQQYLREAIQRQTEVSYALMATVPDEWAQDLQVVKLGPLQRDELELWLLPAIALAGLKFSPGTSALDNFLDSVQGHMGDAIALIRRIWLDLRPLTPSTPVTLIEPEHIHHSLLTLVDDLSLTFESLILLLPPSQVRLLESLALDPTTTPHAREYTQKHQLARGGSLQGALASLQQKGLLYGSEYGYQITLPFLRIWLKQRLL